ncbi:hypothetical protein Bca52824_028303 [Brassica carinata]|uniref:Replication factor A C-terminal domain-containing protein n=1 Tax=Brassica carinata TaxID=52824 RepID=A0A8X7VBZ7_BRACI|nr:hypothetical protein Bca52824_028303 [Brassica carinata]
MSDPPGDKNHLMATIKMDSDVYVTFCSTHTPHAVSLHKRLEAMSGDPSVIVSTSLNPKILGVALRGVAELRARLPKEAKNNAALADELYQRIMIAFLNWIQSPINRQEVGNSESACEITAVKSTMSDDHGEQNRVIATIKLDATITLSLFDSQAVSFHKKLEDMHGDLKVIVATSINPKMVGVCSLMQRREHISVLTRKQMQGKVHFYGDTGLPSSAQLLKGYAKDIDFICSGKVRLDVDKGWCYVACSKCSKKLQRTVIALECVRCNNANAVGVLRYRVELVIADDTAEGAFVCFDGVMTKLHNLRASEASQMLAEEGLNPEDSKVPPFIMDMGVYEYFHEKKSVRGLKHLKRSADSKYDYAPYLYGILMVSRGNTSEGKRYLSTLKWKNDMRGYELIVAGQILRNRTRESIS